ncbi:unnamed protein product, partial [Durusdinium trenchii]
MCLNDSQRAEIFRWKLWATGILVPHDVPHWLSPSFQADSLRAAVGQVFAELEGLQFKLQERKIQVWLLQLKSKHFQAEEQRRLAESAEVERQKVQEELGLSKQEAEKQRRRADSAEACWQKIAQVQANTGLVLLDEAEEQRRLAKAAEVERQKVQEELASSKQEAEKQRRRADSAEALALAEDCAIQANTGLVLLDEAEEQRRLAKAAEVERQKVQEEL